MTQDGNMRTAGKWFVTVYDASNRPLKTGLLTDATTAFSSHLANAASSSSYPSTASGFELLTQNYYDDYSWIVSSGTPLTATLDASNISNSNYFITSYNAAPNFALPIIANYSTRGMITGTKEKILGTSNQFLYSATFYDEKARPVQIQSINASGEKDITTMQYDFSGHPLRNLLEHHKGGTNPQTHIILTKMDYDHGGRLLTIKKIISSTVAGTTINVAEKNIVQNTYDDLGKLKTKKLGIDPNNGNELESLTYDYNIRGWMLGANKNFLAWGTGNYFGFELGYDKPGMLPAAAYTNPEYNGNISGTSWKSKGDGELRRYDFTYGNLNRLTTADFNQYTSGSFNKTANVDFSVSGLDYDANGNILHMNQKGLKINVSSFIDQMTYNYITNTNRLLNVIDASNDATTKLGDFRASALYLQNVPNKTTSTDDYTYDVSGNLIKDYNKDIGTTGTNGIIYNHLNLPQNIVVTNKGSIEYVYDAEGNKLKKIVHETGQPDKKTEYFGGFVYEDDILQFFNHEEGRVRFKPVVGNTTASFTYDYFLKDNLGNVRLVLTEEQQIDMYPAATMETPTAAMEETFYSNLAATREAAPVSNGYPSISGNTNVARVRGDGNKIGPAIVLKVMAGDKFNIIVNSWYKTNGASLGSSTGILTSLLSALTNGVGSLAGGKVTASDLQNASAFNNGAIQFLNNQNTGNNSSKPKAYLNWIVFDEQFNLVSSSSGFEQVGNDQEYKTHVKANMPIDKNGFLYIYVSNETPNIDVFFDNLQVTHVRGPILEETHYYPFGLTMAGISTKAAGKLANKNKFGGKELQSAEFTDGYGLEWSDFGARMLDPQLGWWMVPDPLAEKAYGWTPYRFCFNNPLLFTDPNGKWEFGTQKDDKNKVTLQLKMSEGKKDDLASFKKQSGLSDKKIEKLFGGKEAMTKFFESGQQSIDVSKLSGKLGTMLQGMETALNEGNSQLSAVAKDKNNPGTNNCFSTTINASTSGDILGHPLPALTADNLKTHLASGYGYDAALEAQYNNSTKPELGAAIRYSTDGGISAVHGAVFLLTTEDGKDIQVFTKNGISNDRPYQLDTQSEMLKNNPEYGAAAGRKDYPVKSNYDGSTSNKTDAVPYYIHR